MVYSIESRTLQEQPTAIVRATIPPATVPQWLSRVYRDVFDCLGRVGIRPAGPPFARYTIHDGTFEMEAGVPVASPVTGAGEVMASSLPAGQAAVTTHTGQYEDLEGAFAALLAWVKEHGYRLAGPHWESYLTDPNVQSEPESLQTLVVQPYSQ